MSFSAHYLACRCCLQCRYATHQAFSTSFPKWSAVSDYYDLLGVKKEATMEEVKKAFFDKSKKLHPDSDPSNPSLHSQFVKLNEAYKVLSKESSRQRYDSLRASSRVWPGPSRTASSSPKTGPFRYSNPGPRPNTSSESDERMHYEWEFYPRPAEPYSPAEAKRRHRRNQRLFGYCLLLMLGSMVVHYVAYRKLVEVHNNFMDKKDQHLTSIYNASKEQARVNGIQKQRELLRERHAEFAKQHHVQHSRGSPQK
uniref:DnaJ heat shock protein family (Hsp40) member C4 n=1 Tax=Sphenodon punctatus TaxID=8508 RepID=A0A8D0GFB0_SPHPU